MNEKLQARSYETITNSLSDLISAQDLCKHQSTSAKIKPASHHLFLHITHVYPFSVEVHSLLPVYSLLPVFPLCREIGDKRTTTHMEKRLQCPHAKYIPLQNQHHIGPEKATNLSLKMKKKNLKAQTTDLKRNKREMSHGENFREVSHEKETHKQFHKVFHPVVLPLFPLPFLFSFPEA